MKILILTIGTRGDVQPYIALGIGLRDAGHDVTICTCASFEGFIVEHGLKYAAMNDDMIEFIHSDDGKIAMERSGNLWQMMQTARKLLPKMGDLQRRQIDDTWESTRNVAPDLILFHPKALAASDFAQRLGIPCALAFYLPMFVSTGDFPAMGFANLKLGKWWNRLSYWLLSNATTLATAKCVNRWRQANGLPKRKGKYLEVAGQPIPALHAYSPSVIPQPADWPDLAKVTGYWFLGGSDDWQPSAELSEFLSAGPPPIYIGFGSIFGRDPERLTKTIVDAVGKSNVRAILAAGWGGMSLDSIELPDNILGIETAPHDWLFSKVAAVVHHGGCGTTAAGLRAGRPTLVCPFFGDQPFWGAKVKQLGVGPTPIPQSKLTVDNLAAAIKVLVSDNGIRTAAHNLGVQIRSEDGVGQAVHWIEQWTVNSVLLGQKSDAN